ncbi:anthrone oxygenase family protein [Rhodopirellula sallentina]|uniref:Integral membrane protein n=1 Tax=Rhodopirellula sallentina SM41 TaxID=1263870 RepID=M5U8B8_9BACT|nr:anthrone oxygenase family protein [Rhodopirellula sallentina]EMI57697.1 integral membrane protein [Rhodopirellula sallentina SM41]
MRALADIPGPQGMLAMQRINLRIINPLFVLLFLGTPVCCLVLAFVAIQSLDSPGSLTTLLGAACYLIGPFGITMLKNVPLNNRLAAAELSDTDTVWADYQIRWQRWNHIRTWIGIVSMALLAAGMQRFG